MVRELEPSTNNKEFLLQALEKGLRIDGRGLENDRSAGITVNHQDLGTATVTKGFTRVMASVSYEIARPHPDKPTDGLLLIAMELGTMAAPSLDGMRTEEEVFLERHLEKTIRRSNAIDLEGLCIVAGEKVWRLRVDVHCLDHDGNLLDAACIAVMAALAHFRRPDVSVAGEEVTVHPLDERNPVPLGIHHYPISTSFAFFKGGQTWVVDPTRLEEQVCEGQMAISINSNREICAISKAGGVALDPSVIIGCSELALANSAGLMQMIKEFHRDSDDMDTDKA